MQLIEQVLAAQPRHRMCDMAEALQQIRNERELNALLQAGRQEGLRGRAAGPQGYFHCFQ